MTLLQEVAQATAPGGAVRDASVALASLKGTCLYRMESWWTYEFCFGQGVRQFHQDPQTGQRLSEFWLGRFDATVSALSVVPETKLVKQMFVGGTVCDLNGASRSIEVRYLCNDKASGVTFVGELQEPSTCAYQLSIVTPLVCELVGTKPATKKAVIYCNPVMRAPAAPGPWQEAKPEQRQEPPAAPPLSSSFDEQMEAARRLIEARDWDGAVRQLEEARKLVADAQDMRVVSVAQSMAAAREAQGGHGEEVVRLRHEVLDMVRRLGPSHHKRLPYALQDLASACSREERLRSQALDYQRQAVEAFVQIYGPDDAGTTVAQQILERYKSEQQQDKKEL